MKLIVILAVIGLLFWLAWDKVSTHFDERFGNSEPNAVDTGPPKGDGEKPESGPKEPAPAPEPERPRLEPTPGTVVSEATPAPLNPVAPVEVEEPEKFLIVDRAMRYPVRPEFLEFLRTVSRRSGVAGSDESGVFHDAARSRLFVSCPESKAAHILSVLEAADIPPRQVTVEVCIVIASLTSGQEFGVDWLGSWSPGRADLGTGKVAIGSGTLAINAGAFELALVSAVNAGSASVVSRPSVGAEIGEKASISSGREVGVVSTDSLNGNVVSSVDFKNVTLSIETTVLQAGDLFRVEVTQKNDELAGSSIVEGQTVPEINTQTLQTILMLPSGLWAAAGSVVVERDGTAKSGFRFLPPSQSVASIDRREIGVFIRVVDGLVARPLPASPPLRAEPVQAAKPKVVAKPVTRGFRLRDFYEPPKSKR